jgi:DNA mismatch repair protein MutL
LPIIQVLPSAVADQIAAGEVVERPSSVVKELVENSLDAGATTIEITVEEGGHKLVRVSDDGSGMDREDAALALVRHGTSKIRKAADLVGVSSFGFRGEALPAIASISRFELETSQSDGDGVTLETTGGTVTATRDAARRKGTTVSVGQLFYNVPARKKFLRSARSEWRAITEAVNNVALTRPDVRFSLIHDGKNVLQLPPVSGLRARISGHLGRSLCRRIARLSKMSAAQFK